MLSLQKRQNWKKWVEKNEKALNLCQVWKSTIMKFNRKNKDLNLDGLKDRLYKY